MNRHKIHWRTPSLKTEAVSAVPFVQEHERKQRSRRYSNFMLMGTGNRSLSNDVFESHTSTGSGLFVCCLFWNLVTIIIAFVPVHVYTLKFWEKITFYHFSKKCLFSVFLHIEAQLSLKNAWLPQFSFWISVAPDMIYLSRIVIIWEKILPISGHRP